MKLFTVTNFTILLCGIYILNSAWSIYHLWYPDSCLAKGRKKHCLKSLLHEKRDVNWNVEIYSSDQRQTFVRSSSLIGSWKKFNFAEDMIKQYNCTLLPSTINNGSLFIHVFVFPSGNNQDNFKIHASIPITDYKIPVSYFQLMKDGNEVKHEKQKDLPTTHWRGKLKIYVMYENFMFDNQKIPGELMTLIKLTSKREYLPMLYLDELSFKKSDLVPLPKNATTMELEVEYSPVSVGKLRLWITLTHAMDMMKSLGFTDDDLDDVKGIFTDTNLYLLCLTVIVTAVHILFDFLGFKNDISYWKKRKTMLGLSSHTVIYRCISTVIIFLFLLDQKTSLLVLVPAGIGSLIEIWKVSKALKVNVKRSGWKIRVVFGQISEVEKTTESFDQQAIQYLSYFLYPLCIGGAFYSLFYVPHKSWYSWLIQSLVNGVYAFGFLFMLPQLFINYKLKSVAHLPWKAFMYKAFNTFIDDIFAFIIQMPTSHRLACFRDDVVFFCYLYQLWLYPVDKSRVNEYGYAYEEKHQKKE